MAFLVKYVPIILLRVDIQGILMLWWEENGEGIQVTKIKKEGLVDGLRWKCTLHPECKSL